MVKMTNFGNRAKSFTKKASFFTLLKWGLILLIIYKVYQWVNNIASALTADPEGLGEQVADTAAKFVKGVANGMGFGTSATAQAFLESLEPGDNSSLPDNYDPSDDTKAFMDCCTAGIVHPYGNSSACFDLLSSINGAQFMACVEQFGYQYWTFNMLPLVAGATAFSVLYPKYNLAEVISMMAEHWDNQSDIDALLIQYQDASQGWTLKGLWPGYNSNN